MRNKQRLERWAIGALLALLGPLGGCSQADIEGDRLPDGKYPISFSASVEGLTATRATTGKDTWTMDDEIAVSANANGSNHQVYQITDATTGAMSLKAGGSTLYWQQSRNQPITAWYPATVVTDQNISNQSGGWEAFDYLVSKGNYNFSRSGVSLPFTHAMAKVKFFLYQGEGITADELKAATIQLYGYTKVSFDKGVASTTEQANGEITPLIGQPDYDWSPIPYEALVVPQQMQGEQFIKVIAGGKTYYYTPTAESDANLVAGKQYTYNIAVQKNKLEVTLKENGVAWTDEVQEEEAQEAQLRVYLPNNFAEGNFTITGATQQEGQSYYLTEKSSFSISCPIPYTFDGKFLIAKGLFTDNYKIEDGKYIYTYSLRSDIELEYTDAIQVGYYYNNDGSYSPFPSANCIGLVFHAGKHTSDDSDYSGTDIGGSSFHGYVVALQDAGSGLKWEDKNGTYNQAVGASTSETDWKGYSNSQKIRQYVKSTGGWTLADFPAANACFNFGTAYSKYAVPSGNSGWFMPSEGQLKSLYDNRGILSRQIEKLKGISGMGNISRFSSYYYWSSSESQSNSGYAWCVLFDYVNVRTYAKGNGFDVRAVSAF